MPLSFFFFLTFIFILAVPSLSRRTQSFVRAVGSLGSVGIICGMWIQFPDQGWNLGTLNWELRVPATGPPGKTTRWLFLL